MCYYGAGIIRSADREGSYTAYTQDRYYCDHTAHNTHNPDIGNNGELSLRPFAGHV